VESGIDAENTMTAADAELASRAKGGDAAAFELLYRRNVGRIYAVCYRIAADAERARDLTQQAFIRAWEMLPGFRGESAFSTWLHRIAVNIALTELRSHNRRSNREEPAPDPGELPDRHTHPARGDLVLDIERAIAALPPQARAVFTLHDIEGYKHAEIAEQMGLATGTCKAQLHRARKLLKEVLTS
jgi:RNA polymerase sigma-70 factor (ECF subfamily)